MQSFVFLSLLALASGATLHGDYGSSNSGGDYGSSSSGGSSYGAPKCKPVYKTVKSEHCEPYTERVCRTFQTETCSDIPEKRCRAIVTSKQMRKCFDVNELLCTLKEDVQYEVVQVPFTVQKCHKVQERVCDTVASTDSTSKDDFQCISVQNPVCTNEEHTIYDQTCRTTTSFDCDATSGYGNGGGSSGAYGSGGHGGSDEYGHGGDSYGSGGDSYGSSDDSYGHSKPVCQTKKNTKCYKTPRTVTLQKCSDRTEKACEKLRFTMPTVSEEQNCHNEDKKVCDLEQRTQSKQVKKYVYTKQCRSVPRQVCANSDVKDLVPSCVSSSRKQCHYSPIEKCEDVPKKHCFTVSRQVMTQKCEDSGYGGGSEPSYGGGSSDGHYDQPAPGGYEQPAEY